MKGHHLTNKAYSMDNTIKYSLDERVHRPQTAITFSDHAILHARSING